MTDKEEKCMLNQFSRTELLFGKAAMEKLASSRVAVFGIGGVGYSVGASFLSYLLFKGFYGGGDERIHCLDSLCRIHKAD